MSFTWSWADYEREARKWERATGKRAARPHLKFNAGQSERADLGRVHDQPAKSRNSSGAAARSRPAAQEHDAGEGARPSAPPTDRGGASLLRRTAPTPQARVIAQPAPSSAMKPLPRASALLKDDAQPVSRAITVIRRSAVPPDNYDRRAKGQSVWCDQCERLVACDKVLRCRSQFCKAKKAATEKVRAA